MNPSIPSIIAILGIGAAKGLSGSKSTIINDFNQKVVSIVGNMSKCLKITDEVDISILFSRFIKEKENDEHFQAFIDNLYQMESSDFNDKYYVKLTNQEFFDILNDYYQKFSYWYNKPFIDLSPSGTEDINKVLLLTVTPEKNPLMQLRDLFLKKGYRYLPAYYAVKDFDFIPTELKPYQVLFIKTLLNSDLTGWQSKKYIKPLRPSKVEWRVVDAMMENMKEVSLKRSGKQSVFSPSWNSLFDRDFEQIIARVWLKLKTKDKDFISQTMNADLSTIDLPNFMPPKEMIILFWSYTGVLYPNVNVTRLWKEV